MNKKLKNHLQILIDALIKQYQRECLVVTEALDKKIVTFLTTQEKQNIPKINH